MTYMPFIYILFVHWVGDFVCQTHWMASGKSKRMLPLVLHILAYESVLLIGIVVGFLLEVFPAPHPNGRFGIFLFVLINSLAHLATDYVTSRVTSKLWAKSDVHNFFVVIGFDQFLHFLVLGLTMELLG